MKIIQVLNYFLPHQKAGTEVYTWALSTQLKKQGHIVKIIVPNYGKKINEYYTFDSIEVIKFAEDSIVDRSLIMGKKIPNGVETFIQIIGDEMPDVVHFHELAGSNGIGIEHLRRVKQLGVKVIMTFHLAGYSCLSGTLVQNGAKLCDGKIETYKCSVCYLKKKKLGPFTKSFATLSNSSLKLGINPTLWNHSFGTFLGTAQLVQNLKQRLGEIAILSDKIVCITHWYRELLVKNGIESSKIEVIPQGIPTMPLIKLPQIKRHKKLRLLFLGRISEFKGLHLLIDAMKNIPEEKIELSIYGKGDATKYEPNLRLKTSKKSNIFWRGELAQEKVYQVMREHDFLCVCSTFSEMSPLVIQEAIVAGLPVLASNVYGNIEHIKHGINGYIFQINNKKDLEKLLTIIINESNISELRHHAKPIEFDLIARIYSKVYRC